MSILKGENIIGSAFSSESDQKITSINPATQQMLEGEFYLATDGEIKKAVEVAHKAFNVFKFIENNRKAEFLVCIADEIIRLGDLLIERAAAETALPTQRLIGERGRTINQLLLFAELVKEGSWVEASIDLAQPERSPFPKPDLRKMLIPVGPVVVFTASNFPLAFSTAGGDTASALAIGNPVIVKAHESHLGTNFLVGKAIQAAATKTGMPDGVFSSLNGSGYSLGKKLVKHPLVKSVAFTGSQKGGLDLFKTAQERKNPIPVFAEMGSINPMILLPNKVKQDTDGLAQQLVGSITLGAGQFCTNPGLLICLKNEQTDILLERLAYHIENTTPGTMLNSGIQQNYAHCYHNIGKQKGLKVLASAISSNLINEGLPILAHINGEDFLTNKILKDEIFGPFSLVVTCNNTEELLTVLDSLEGQLTISFIGDEEELKQNQLLISKADSIAGRILFNGVPTGVEVSHAMHHGGPFPSSTDARYTSVGTDAVKRFVKPICYQNAPEFILPKELQDLNPLNIWRKIDGVITKKALNKATENA